MYTDINNKLVIVKYNSLEDLFEREEAMTKTLLNNLKREETYRYIRSFITMTKDKFLLNLEIAPIV